MLEYHMPPFPLKIMKSSSFKVHKSSLNFDFRSDEWWFFWHRLVGIAQMSVTPNSEIRHHLCPIGHASPFPVRNFNETARYVDQGGGKRKGAFAMYLVPWKQGIKIKSIQSNPMIFHDIYDMLISNCESLADIVFVVLTCLFLSLYTMLPKLEMVCPNLADSLQVYNKFGVVEFLLRVFSPTHLSNIISPHLRLPFLVCGFLVFFPSVHKTKLPNLGSGAMACRCLRLSGAAKKPRQGGATCQVLCYGAYWQKMWCWCGGWKSDMMQV